MHPKALLDACAELVRLTLKFDHPADAIVARFFRDNRGLGPRERATMAETVYTVLRKKQLFDHLAPSGSGPKERRLAILGFYGPGDFLRSALTDQETRWIDECEKVDPADLMERHRHNLPEWLVQPLKDQLGTGFWPLVESLNKGAGLDLRVNDFKAKRSDIQKELAQAGIKAVPTPYSGKIDRVLVDAPCTGLGTLRRNPDLKWRQTMQTVEEMAVKQTAILQSASRLLKSGGRLVYATCSVLPQENEAIAEAFSLANPDFVPMSVGEVLTGLKVNDSASLCSGGEDAQLYLRLWPHKHQTDGFFAAVWQKK